MLMFNNLLRIFHRRPARLTGKPIMIVPYLQAIRDVHQVDTVAAQTKECSRQLASTLYVWRRSFPAKSTLKTWNAADLCFTGMDLDLFIEYLTANYRFHTEDSREWILDRAIASLIWDTCTAEDTPLREASWLLERTFKREAGK